MASKVRDNTIYCAGVRGRREAMMGRRPLTGSVTAQGEYRTTRQIRGRTPFRSLAATSGTGRPHCGASLLTDGSARFFPSSLA